MSKLASLCALVAAFGCNPNGVTADSTTGTEATGETDAAGSGVEGTDEGGPAGSSSADSDETAETGNGDGDGDGDGEPGALDDECQPGVDSNPTLGDTCEEGLACVFATPAELVGVCKAVCADGPENGSCADGEACHVFDVLEQDPDAPPGLTVPICLPTCDPLAQDCDTSETCMPNEGGPVQWPHDVPANSTNAEFVCAPSVSFSSAGALCSAHWNCDPGSVCISGCFDSESCCTPMCDLAAPDCEGNICKPIYSPATPGHEDAGVCVFAESPFSP